MLLALCGLQGAGKDAVACMLVERHGFARATFGAALKDAVACTFGWDRGLLEGATPESRAWRESVDPWWATRLGMPGLTPRRALQLFGTDAVRRHFHPEVWLAGVERGLDLAPHRPTVITDCRFPEEIEMVRRRGGRLVFVSRPPLPGWFHAYRCGVLGRPPDDVHESEFAWARARFDWVINNTAGLDQLEAACDAMGDALLTCSSRSAAPSSAGP